MRSPDFRKPRHRIHAKFRRPFGLISCLTGPKALSRSLRLRLCSWTCEDAVHVTSLSSPGIGREGNAEELRISIAGFPFLPDS